jgi:hypothetical protein
MLILTALGVCVKIRCKYRIGKGVYQFATK